MYVFVSAEAAAEALHSAKKAFQRALFMQPQRHQAWTNLGYTCLTQVGEGKAERRHVSLFLPPPPFPLHALARACWLFFFLSGGHCSL